MASCNHIVGNCFRILEVCSDLGIIVAHDISGCTHECPCGTCSIALGNTCPHCCDASSTSRKALAYCSSCGGTRCSKDVPDPTSYRGTVPICIHEGIGSSTSNC